jgi:LPS O-antigen subunit length determinant protein (WzzB/FepE family)
MPLDVLVAGLWRRAFRVALLAALLFAAGGAAILVWPRAYLAQMVLAPAETTGIATSSLLSATPVVGGLFDPRPTGNFAIYLGALRSAEAASMLAADTDLLPWLRARRAEGPMGAVRAMFDLTRQTDLDDARAWLEREVAVTQTPGAVTWTVALAHPDRAAALDMLRRLHAFAEGKVRADLGEMARRRIQALEARLQREPDMYVRQSLYELLAQQQRAGVVVAADEAVAARLVSAPMVEHRASRPNRSLLLLLLVVAAPMAALGIAAAILLLRGPPSVAAARPRLEPAE